MQKFLLFLLCLLGSTAGHTILFTVDNNISKRVHFKLEVLAFAKTGNFCFPLEEYAEQYHQRTYNYDNNESDVHASLTSAKVLKIDLAAYSKFVRENLDDGFKLLIFIQITHGRKTIYRHFFNECNDDPDDYLIGIAKGERGNYISQAGEIVFEK